MTKAERIRLAKHYLSLDEKGRRKQKELAKYVPEYEQEVKIGNIELPKKESKGILDSIKRGFMPTEGDEE